MIAGWIFHSLIPYIILFDCLKVREHQNHLKPPARRVALMVRCFCFCFSAWSGSLASNSPWTFRKSWGCESKLFFCTNAGHERFHWWSMMLQACPCTITIMGGCPSCIVRQICQIDILPWLRCSNSKAKAMANWSALPTAGWKASNGSPSRNKGSWLESHHPTHWMSIQSLNRTFFGT